LAKIWTKVKLHVFYGPQCIYYTIIKFTLNDYISGVTLVYTTSPQSYLYGWDTVFVVQATESKHFITSAKEVMFLPEFVCLSVCQQDNSKIYGWIFVKFSGNVGNGKNYKWFNFGGDPEKSWILDHFEIFVSIAFNGAVSNQYAWRRSALSECFSSFSC